MKAETFLKRIGVAMSSATLAITLVACSHHPVTDGQDYGQVRTEANVTQSTASTDQVVGTVPAPANAQNTTDKAAPAIISGPAKVDDSGRAYTSSATGGTGNSNGTGLNTNVNIVPAKSTSSVTVTQSPAVTESTTVTTPVVTTPVVTETPAPAAPVITETTTTETTTVPMTSSTTQEQTTTETKTTSHRRMRKD